MKTLKEFRQLNEIGDGTKPYKWRLVKANTAHGAGEENVFYVYKFKADDGKEFTVGIDATVFFRGQRLESDTEIRSHELDVTFMTAQTGVDATGSGTEQMFRVMTTVTDIVKDCMKREKKRGKVTYITFTTGGKDEKNKQGKLKLYSAYIKKNLKGAHITSTARNQFMVELD
jgi:hypothetical protein